MPDYMVIVKVLTNYLGTPARPVKGDHRYIHRFLSAAKKQAANAYQGTAFFQRYFIVAAHAHADS